MRMIIRARRVGATLLLAAVAALPAACSTVQSIDLTKDTAGIRSGSYLTYAVAKSVFTIQITAGGGGSSSGGGGGGKDKDKDKGSPPEVPAVPTSWTLSGTLTADGAKPASEPSKKAATDSSECGVMNHEYAAVQAEAAGVQETYGSLSMRLAQMIVGKPGDDDADKLSKGLLAYYQLVTGPHYRALVYRLDGATPSRAETMFRALIERCPPILSVQIQQAVLPDPSRTFALKQSTNIFYNDTMTFATDTNGFLTSGAPSSASQVTQIGSAIANDIGLLFPTGAGMVNVPPLSAAFVTPLDCKGAMPGDLKGQIEALGDCPDRASEIAALIAAHLTKPGAVASLPSAALPMTFYVPIDVLEENSARQDDPMQAVRDRLEVFGLTLSMKCSARGTSRRDGIPEGAAFTSDTLGAPMKGVYDGLVVSAPRACQFQALQKRYVAGADGLAMASKQAVTVAQSSFWAQDSRYLTLLPTQRGFLVARSVSYSFAGGQATGVTDNRPSEALAVVSFPGAVVGSFFSGITSAFKNSDVITGGKTGELTAQTEYLTAQMKYLQAKQELEKANGSATP